MSRFAGIKNNNICIISDKLFVNENYNIVEVPIELDNVSNNDLIVNFKLKDGKLYSKYNKKSAKDLKVALVGNYRMKCGISTYNENLWAEIYKLVGDIKLFIEYNDFPTGDIYKIGDNILSSDKVLSCWKRGESLKDLIINIKEYNPDIILIGHEFGLFNNSRYFLSMMNQLSDYRVIVTMHSIFHHKDKTIIEAAIPEIVVHLQGAYDILKKEKEINGNVYIIPHGCDPCINKERLWNFYKSNYTFVQFGFGFRYKCFENSIKAVGILKNKYPDVFFTALFSESDFCKVDHKIYYNELMELITELKLEENVAIIKGYQSDTTLDAYLRTNQVAVFPYTSEKNQECMGSSGAAVFSMTKATPVITSRVPHFNGLPSIKADTPEEIANALESLFGKWDKIKEQVDIQNKYLEDNSWSKIAQQYVNLFENCNK